MNNKNIGILSLQGDYEKHGRVVEKLGWKFSLIRYASELDDIDGLIIPGGESTTLTHLMKQNRLYEPINKFSEEKPILGTCAGLIMMASKVENPLVTPLNILDIDVNRNAYGRQIHSFTNKLSVCLNGQKESISATFIRAPKIIRMGKGVEVLAEYNREPCAIKQGLHFGLSFHPELDDVLIFHQSVFGHSHYNEVEQEQQYAA